MRNAPTGPRSTIWPPNQQGRLQRLMDRSPFWFEVMHGVTSAVTAAFIVAWVASTIAIAARGGAGADVQWLAALAWSITFALLGVSIVSLTAITYALVNGGDSDGWLMRGGAQGAAACSWVVAVGSMTVAPEKGIVPIFVVLVVTLPLVAGLPWLVVRTPTRLRQVGRLVFLLASLLVGCMGTALLGLALASVYVRMKSG